ncbi:MAG: aspartate/glutamate racemase family protein [Ectothiorhodospiraceae bacterium]|nr:aspartate/glutamate racemase family protein [Chromatiales bacterium]MCP5153327.1 aspartate/glutamate racemase family protein [Ectothiorhodospiraceae bacterium]
MKRLGVLHTLVFLADRFKSMLAERYPGLDSFHVIDESLLKDALRHGGLTPSVIRRTAQQACLVRDAGAEVILFTCSSTSPAVDVARRLVDVPIVKIDDAMAATAVRAGGRIGLVCTASSTVEASSGLLRQHAADQGRAIELVTELRADAFAAVNAGDRDRHDAILRDTVRDLAGRCDVVVLAQASMAHLQPELDAELAVPVLASPRLCVEALAEQLG